MNYNVIDKGGNGLIPISSLSKNQLEYFKEQFEIENLDHTPHYKEIVERLEKFYRLSNKTDEGFKLRGAL